MQCVMRCESVNSGVMRNLHTAACFDVWLPHVTSNVVHAVSAACHYIIMIGIYYEY